MAGRYRVEVLLGVGGMASVYRAVDEELGRPVALKMLDPGVAGIESVEITRERFIREARAMAAIDSPHVVPIYDLGQSGDQLFLVEKLLSGLRFDVFVREQRPELPVVVCLIDDALVGLDALHLAGMVHRDINPSNIFVTDRRRAVLIDLGIVLTGDKRLTERSQVLGTPEFMAPEQATGGEPGPRSDLYALGLLLLYVAGGQPELAEDEALIQRRLAGDAWLRPELDCVAPALRPFLRKALAHDPEARFASAAEMRAALLAVPDLEDPGPTLRIARIEKK